MGHEHGIHWSYHNLHHTGATGHYRTLDRPSEGTSDAPALRKCSEGMGLRLLGHSIFISQRPLYGAVFSTGKVCGCRRGGTRCGSTYHHFQSSTRGFYTSCLYNSGLCRVGGPGSQTKRGAFLQEHMTEFPLNYIL